jgi:uncharacterized delta-60 repeat protein
MRFSFTLILSLNILLILRFPAIAQIKLSEINKTTVDFQNVGTNTIDNVQASAFRNDSLTLIRRYENEGVMVTKYSANGVQDLNFGNNGITYIAKSFCADTAFIYRSVKYDWDGNLFLAGTQGQKILLTKIKSNGIIDSSFGENGHLIIRRFPLNYQIYTPMLEIMPDGKILLIYGFNDYSQRYFELEKFHQDGQKDLTFNVNPKLASKITNMKDPPVLSLDMDGKIVLCGSRTTGPGGYHDIYVARLFSSGVYDVSFGSLGVAPVFGPSNRTTVHGIHIDSVNQMYINGIGLFNTPRVYSVGFIIKLNAQGQKDITFGNNGTVANEGNYYSVLTVKDQRIITAGSYLHEGNLGIRVWDHNGFPDTSFGAGGVFIGPKTNLSYITQLYISDERAMIMACSDAVGSNSFLQKITWEGKADESIGSNGVKHLYHFLDGGDKGSHIIRDEQGSLFILGSVDHDQSGNVGVVKMLPDGSLDPTFGVRGKVEIDLTGSTIREKIFFGTVDENQNIFLSGIPYNHNGFWASESYNLTKLNRIGQVDSSFGTNGRMNSSHLKEFYPNTSLIHNNKVIVVGRSRLNNLSKFGIAIVRYNLDGSLDTTFNKTGYYFKYEYSDTQFQSLTVDSVNNIYVAGEQTGGNNLCFIYKFRPDGVVDSTFGTNGFAVFKAGFNTHLPTPLKITKDNCLLMGVSPDARALSLIKVRMDGIADSTFGVNGILSIPRNQLKKITDFVQLKDSTYLV